AVGLDISSLPRTQNTLFGDCERLVDTVVVPTTTRFLYSWSSNATLGSPRDDSTTRDVEKKQIELITASVLQRAKKASEVSYTIWDLLRGEAICRGRRSRVCSRVFSVVVAPTQS
ncbi:unnamed protein product, partial [Ectocarpus fasciculatus]